MIEIIGLTYILTAFCFIKHYTKREGPSPSLMWVLMQAIMFIGIASIIDINKSADRLFLFLNWSALFIFILGNRFCNYIRSSTTINNSGKILFRINSNGLFWLKCFIVIVVSFIACSYLYSKVSNVIYVLISSFLNGGQLVSIERFRFAFTQVRGNGYIYQFRVVLLPILNIALLLSGNNKLKLAAYSLAPFTLFFLLGTGQRGGAVLMFIVFYINIVLLKKYLKCRTPKIFYVVLIFGILIFIVLTIANDRVQNSGNIFNAIMDRLFFDNQYTATIGFRYIFEQPTQFGYDWLMRIRNVLPWKVPHIPLDFIINDIIYGGYGGTCPPSAIGSMYYNLGLFGTLLFIFLLGYIYRIIEIIFINKRKTSFDLTFYSFYTVSLGTWIAGDISFLFNDGIVAVLILHLLMNLYTRKRIPFSYVSNERQPLQVRKRSSQPAGF